MIQFFSVYHQIKICIFNLAFRYSFLSNYLVMLLRLFKRDIKLLKRFLGIDSYEKLKLQPPGRPGVHRAVRPGSSVSSAGSFQADPLWSEWWSLLGRRPEAPCRTSQPRCFGSDHTPWDISTYTVILYNIKTTTHNYGKLCLLGFKGGLIASSLLLRCVYYRACVRVSM